MNVLYITLNRGVQTPYGMLKGSYTSKPNPTGGNYEMVYLPRLQLVQMDHENWRAAPHYQGPVCIGPTAIDCMQTEKPLSKPKEDQQ